MGTEFVYVKFFTPKGEGYGCFAMDLVPGTDNIVVGASFCSPLNQLNKTSAKKIATGRARKNKILLKKNSTYEQLISDYFASAVELASNKKLTSNKKNDESKRRGFPNWALKSFARKRYSIGINPLNGASKVIYVACGKHNNENVLVSGYTPQEARTLFLDKYPNTKFSVMEYKLTENKKKTK